MRRLIRATLRKKKPKRELPGSPEPPEPYRMAGPAHGQEQSLLFSLLSLDIRLLIYEVVFSTNQLLHITPWRGSTQPDRIQLGHWHCVDAQSPFPTWQHTCYGIYIEEGAYNHRIQPRSDSDLLPFLLACRKS